MKHEITAYLKDIDESSRNIIDFLADLHVDEYLENRMVKAAVERQFEIIGEVLNRMSREFPLAYAKIRNARQIIDFRNLISHGYDVINDERVFNIAKLNTPELLKDINKIKSERKLS